MVGTAGEEYADPWLVLKLLFAEAPPSKAVNSSKRSISAGGCESQEFA